MTVTILHKDEQGHRMLRLLRWSVPAFQPVEGGAQIETEDTRDLIRELRPSVVHREDDPADVEGRAFAMEMMRTAGLEVRVDPVGNIFGRRPGRDAAAAPILFGSHIDSVPEGGNYDGDVGSMSAIDCENVQ